MTPTDRQRVLRFLSNPPAPRTREELMIMLTGIVYWDEREDLSAADVAKVDAAEQLLAAMVMAGELSHVPDDDGDRSVDLFGPPEKPR